MLESDITLYVSDFNEENIIKGGEKGMCDVAISRQANTISEMLICAVVL